MTARRLGVGEEVAQLLLDVAVVDVERGHPGQVGADHALDVFVAVVEVEPQVVLGRLVAGEALAPAVRAEALGVQVAGQPPGAVAELARS